jgi:hypothetical protein
VSLLLDAARVAAGTNILLLLVLLGIWGRTYREVRAPLTLGSMVFAGFLLAENAVAVWFYSTAPALPGIAVEVMMTLQLLETVGIAALTYVTWQ